MTAEGVQAPAVGRAIVSIPMFVVPMTFEELNRRAPTAICVGNADQYSSNSSDDDSRAFDVHDTLQQVSDRPRYSYRFPQSQSSI